MIIKGQEITCDTELNDVLESGKIIELIGNLHTNVNSTISSRTGVLTTALQSNGGLDASQVIEGEAVFTISGKTIVDKYAEVANQITTFANSVGAIAIEREKIELTTLDSKITTKLTSLAEEISNAKETEEASLLHQGSQFAMVAPQVTSAKLEQAQTLYREKRELVRARMLKLDPDYIFPSLDVEAEIPVSAGNGDTESGGDTSETDTTQPTNTSNYTIGTEESANDMYQSALDLSSEVNLEMSYLSDRIANINYNQIILDSYHDQGLISDEDYNRISAQYAELSSQYEAALQERSDLSNAINTATINNAGTHDGPLKDARDWGHNDTEAAIAEVEKINEIASGITPINQIATETCDDGTTRIPMPMLPLYGYGGQNNEFMGNVAGITSNGAGQTTISQPTLEAAYIVAQNNGNVSQYGDNSGVYIFSVNDFYNCDAATHLMPPTGGVSQSEYTIASNNAMYGTYESSGDTIYDSNTGMFYSYAEYLALQGIEY